MKNWRNHFQVFLVTMGGIFAFLYLAFSPLFHLGFHLIWGYQTVGSITYLGQNLSTNQQKTLHLTHQTAIEKINRFWGTQQATPSLIICATENQFRSICRQSEGAGCSLGTPMGSWVILLEQDTDVLAHELAHSEMIHRWGYWTTRLKIPTWLEEGIALQVDDRFVHAEDSISRFIDFDTEWQVMTFGGRYSPTLSELVQSQDFFQGTESDVRLAYLTSGRQVSQWWAYKGRGFIWNEVDTYRQRGWWEVISTGKSGDAKASDPTPQSLFYEQGSGTRHWYANYTPGVPHRAGSSIHLGMFLPK